jgi:hypothetical protein
MADQQMKAQVLRQFRIVSDKSKPGLAVLVMGGKDKEKPQLFAVDREGLEKIARATRDYAAKMPDKKAADAKKPAN